jgi:hypothetical protein
MVRAKPKRRAKFLDRFIHFADRLVTPCQFVVTLKRIPILSNGLAEFFDRFHVKTLRCQGQSIFAVGASCVSVGLGRRLSRRWRESQFFEKLGSEHDVLDRSDLGEQSGHIASEFA